MIKLTADGLHRIFPNAPQVYIDELVKNQGHLAKAGILKNRQRLAYCLANVEHESGGFAIRNLTENINYTAARAAQIWPSRFRSAADVESRFGTAPGWQLKMFDSVYGNRMGNRPGTSDGSRYIGRGACQHTGRDGYAEMEKRTGIKLVDHPELAAKPEHQAALIAAFWSWKDMNIPADAGDFTAVVRRWNGGTIGMADRRARLAGNDIAIRDLPDIERMEVETAALPRKTTATEIGAGVGGVVGGAGAVVAVGIERDWGITEWIMAVVLLAVAAGVAYFVIKKFRTKPTAVHSSAPLPISPVPGTASEPETVEPKGKTDA